MSNPKLKKAAPASAGDGLLDDRLSGTIPPKINQLHDLVEVLEIVVEWRDDLERRAARAQLALEHRLLSEASQDALLREGRALNCIMRHLTEDLRRGVAP